jgi:hypothetical protein
MTAPGVTYGEATLMACYMHECSACDWWDGSNSPGPRHCPECGADVSTVYDEPDEWEPEEDDDDE